MRLFEIIFKRPWLWLCALALTMNLSLLLWYTFKGYKYIIHADSASRVLLAREIFDAGNLFPADWFYVNGDILAFSVHLAVLPFLNFLPAGFLVHALSSFLFLALVLYGVWLLTEILPLNLERRLLLLAIFVGGLSATTAEYVFGQLTYGVILGFCCYLLYFTYKTIDCEKPKARIGFSVLLIIASFLASASNPYRALVYYFFPLIAALSFHGFQADRQRLPSPRFKRVLLSGILSLLGATVGAIFYAVLFPKLLNTQGVGEARWLSPQLMLRNLGLLWTQYLSAFGALAPVDGRVISGAGIYWAAKLWIVIFLLWLIPAACRKQLEHGLSGGAFLTVFAISLGLITLFFQLTTSITDVGDPAASSRYLLPGAILLLFAGMTYRFDLKFSPIYSLGAILAAAVFVCTSWVSLYANVASGENAKKSADLKALQEYLFDNGLPYGYASYWNAAPLSVLSNERVRVRPIFAMDRLPAPAPWISSRRWYKASEWRKSTFLLLTPDEVKSIDWKSMASHGAVPLYQLNFRGFAIFVFKDNIAAYALPGWPAPFPNEKINPFASAN